jgi:retron-type reverse transcriptase
MDFESFFPSFDVDGVSAFLLAENERRGLSLSAQDIRFATLIVARYGHLTIGAPSSPILTNAMMYSFDEALNKICIQRKLTYTRYADDLFFSSYEKDCLDEMVGIVRGLADAQNFMHLRIAEEKTARLSKKYRRSITGLVITPDGRVSIGRGRKRMIKSLVYRYGRDDLDQSEISYLSGMVAFAYDVEPSFFEALVQKYGTDLMLRVQKPHLGDHGDG